MLLYLTDYQIVFIAILLKIPYLKTVSVKIDGILFNMRESFGMLKKLINGVCIRRISELDRFIALIVMFHIR
jgi:hypothetical protein